MNNYPERITLSTKKSGEVNIMFQTSSYVILDKDVEYVRSDLTDRVVPDAVEALQALYDAQTKPTFEIVGNDVDGHPLNALGVARKNAKAILDRLKGVK